MPEGRAGTAVNQRGALEPFLCLGHPATVTPKQDMGPPSLLLRAGASGAAPPARDLPPGWVAFPLLPEMRPKYISQLKSGHGRRGRFCKSEGIRGSGGDRTHQPHHPSGDLRVPTWTNARVTTRTGRWASWGRALELTPLS